MNRYPLWKYLTVLVALVIGLLYTLPNFFGESPAVQIAGAKTTVKIDNSVLGRVQEVLKNNNIVPTGAYYEQNGPVGAVRVRFESTDVQLKAKDIIEKAFNPDPSDPDYTIALNLLPASPNWLSALGAHPMYLGLDLRGGVHFLLQVDMRGALTGRYDSLANDIRTSLREAKLSAANVERNDLSIIATFDKGDTRDAAVSELRRRMADMEFISRDTGGKFTFSAALTPAAITQVQNNALKQNITTLHNRINELGVAEPIIQQQGSDRIVVQLPGVQDVAKAKEILGRTATLEIRMVDDSPSAMAALNSGTVPFGLERYTDRDGRALLLKRQVILTGENLQDAQPGRDQQTQQPSVNLTLDECSHIEGVPLLCLVDEGRVEVMLRLRPVVPCERAFTPVVSVQPVRLHVHLRSLGVRNAAKYHQLRGADRPAIRAEIKLQERLPGQACGACLDRQFGACPEIGGGIRASTHVCVV